MCSGAPGNRYAEDKSARGEDIAGMRRNHYSAATKGRNGIEYQ